MDVAWKALRRLHLKRDPAALATCLQTLHAYISNLAKNPQESKFHSINCQNGNFRSRVASLEGGIAVLEACGFVAVDEKLCVDPDFMRSKGPKLWDALSKVSVLLEQVKSCMEIRAN
ncbi:ubxn-6 [Symbiodinium natans]|uniref:Ubxn-6 protein n=1 Tax=Symbiodinium natans TaxID=878477 RepID=A0A812MXI8_9DINO|nr:ubxn-6 [Symbiodinium natans]